MAKKTRNSVEDEMLAQEMARFDSINYPDPGPAGLDEMQDSMPDDGQSVEDFRNHNMASDMLNHSINHLPGQNPLADPEGDKEMVQKKGLSRVGDNIFHKTEIREGWIPVDRDLLGERNLFYPKDWQFSIRPATVEAIRNWSTIDDENGNSIDEVFNEVLKSCLAIKTGTGAPLPWYNICSWDRFYFILLIREYTFQQGESAIKYYEECPNCEGNVEFNLTSWSLMYDLPDEEVLKYYDRNSRTWMIDPTEYDVEGDPITLFVPTLEKDANVKNWMISRLQENRNAKIDPVFIRFVSWMTPKISKDAEMAKRQMKQLKLAFDSMDIDQFELMDEIIKNIVVTPSTTIKAVCPSCGEEVTSPIRFQDGVSSLFANKSKRKRFGKK